MRVLWLSLALLGCHRDDPPVAKRDPVVAAPPRVQLGPVTVTPAVPPLVTGMMDHADIFGWSSDGSVFGFCQTDGGMGARHCQLLLRGGPREKLDDIDPKTHDIDPKRTATLDARVAKLGLAVRPAQWAHALDLEIVWEVVDGDSESTPPRRAVLRVGTRARGRPPAYVVELSGSSDFHETIHPEAIAVSSDGKLLGVIAHAYGGEFTDELLASVVPIESR